MNSMVATMMSARAMSSRQRCRAVGSVPHSSAAWMVSARPGMSEESRPAAAGGRTRQVTVHGHEDESERRSFSG